MTLHLLPTRSTSTWWEVLSHLRVVPAPDPLDLDELPATVDAAREFLACRRPSRACR